MREKLLAYLKKADREEIVKLFEDLDDYCGYLGESRYKPMKCLYQDYEDKSATELIKDIKYGYAEYGEGFDINAQYYKHNPDGSLISANVIDYYDYIDMPFVDSLIYAMENGFDADNYAIKDILDGKDVEDQFIVFVECKITFDEMPKSLDEAIDKVFSISNILDWRELPNTSQNRKALQDLLNEYNYSYTDFAINGDISKPFCYAYIEYFTKNQDGINVSNTLVYPKES